MSSPPTITKRTRKHLCVKNVGTGGHATEINPSLPHMEGQDHHLIHAYHAYPPLHLIDDDTPSDIPKHLASAIVFSANDCHIPVLKTLCVSETGFCSHATNKENAQEGTKLSPTICRVPKPGPLFTTINTGPRRSPHHHHSRSFKRVPQWLTLLCSLLAFVSSLSSAAALLR